MRTFANSVFLGVYGGDSWLPGGSSPTTIAFQADASQSAFAVVFQAGGGGSSVSYITIKLDNVSFSATINNGGVGATGAVSSGPQTFVVVWNQNGSGLIAIYANGALVATATETLDVVSGDAAAIGASINSALPFAGTIGAFGIYSTALGDTAAKALSLATPTPTSAANCLAFWPMADASDLSDSSGHGHTLYVQPNAIGNAFDAGMILKSGGA